MSEPTSQPDDHGSSEEKPGLLDRLTSLVTGGSRREEGPESGAATPTDGEEGDEVTEPGAEAAAGQEYAGRHSRREDSEESTSAERSDDSSVEDSGSEERQDAAGDDAGEDAADDAGDDAGDEHADDEAASPSQEHEDLGSDEDGQPSVGAMPDPEDVDTDAIEEERSERLDPENRPDNVEVDNTERDFDSAKGLFTDSEGYDEAEAKFDDEAF